MFKGLIVFCLIAVHANHISPISPANSSATQCTACPSPSISCISTRNSAPLINLYAPRCSGQCPSFNLVVPRSVQDVNSAYDWETTYTPIPFPSSKNTVTLCANGYYLFGLTYICTDGLFTSLLCKRATNLPVQWGAGNVAVKVTASNPWGSAAGTYGCPSGQYLVGFGTGANIDKYSQLALYCATPPDVVCPAPPDLNTVFTVASGCSTIHQYCVVTLTCKPFYQPLNGSSAVECRPAAGHPPGAAYNASTLRCVDIDECENGYYCGVNTVCTNVVGGPPTCRCQPGFKSFLGVCVNVDECSTPCTDGADPIVNQCHNCGSGSQCVDTIGSFTCVNLINPCLVRCSSFITTNCNNCSNLSTNCVNTPGNGYTCTCPSGYSTVDQGWTCVDIDECQTFPCSSVSTCQNVDGGYECNCLPGYEKLNASSPCTPINECALASTCPNSTQCVDTTPFYYCLPQITQVFKELTPAPFTLTSTAQVVPDVVSVTVLREAFCVRSNFLFYGATNQFQTSACVTTDSANSSYTLTCEMAAGAGGNLSFSVQCCPNSTWPIAQPCVLVPAPSFVFSYPRPTLTSPSLDYVGNPDGIGVAQIDTTQSGVVLSMEGTNLFSSETQVFFGPSTQPLLYACDVKAANFTSVSCTPQIVAGSNYTMTVVVGAGPNAQLSEAGLDLLSFVGDSPVVYNLTGCTKHGIGIKDCPTEGGVELVVDAQTAKGFSLTEPELLIGGQRCIQQGPLTSSGFRCLLPPGTGTSVTVELRDLSTSWFGAIVSYAAPQITRISSDSCDSESALALTNCHSPLVLSIEGSNFGPAGALVTVATEMLAAEHVSFLSSPTGPNGYHHYLLVNVTSPKRVNAVVVQQMNGGSSKQVVSLTLAPCADGYVRVAEVCVQCDPGRYGLSQTCLFCTAGYFQPLAGQTSCTRCPVGTVQNAAGQINCTSCEAGSFSNVAQSLCESCPQGKFNPLARQSTCIDCAAGQYQPGEAASACIPCLAGTYSTPNAISCEECPPGRVSQTNGTAKCIPCPPGTSQSVPGQSVCEDCDKGFYIAVSSSPFCLQCAPGTAQDIKRQTSCQQCSLGRAQSEAGASACSECVAGSVAADYGASSCEACVVGRFANSSGLSTCVLCERGSSQQEPGSVECKLCEPGTFAGTTGLERCTVCAAGYFQNVSGASFCSLCEAGSYSSSRGSQQCAPCDIGKFQPGKGQSRCSPCSPGLYQDTHSSTSCLSCPGGSASIAEAASFCATCPAATFSLDGANLCMPCALNYVQPLENQTFCTKCPSGSNANEMGTRCICQVGHYAYQQKGGLSCVRCPPGSGSCLQVGQTFESVTTLYGWWRHDTNATTFYRCHIPLFCLGHDRCQPFREGPMCALCVPGYKSSGPGSSCEPCPPTLAAAWGITVVIIAALLALLIALYSVALRVANAQQARLFQIVDINNKLAQEKLAKRLRTDDAYFDDLRTEIQQSNNGTVDTSIVDEEPENVPSVDNEDKEARLKLTVEDTSRRAPNFMYKLKILIGFFQIASYLPSQGDISWPQAYIDFITTFSFFNFDFIPWQSLGCAATINYFVKSIIVGFVPVAAVIVLIIYFLVGMLISDTRSLMTQMESGQQKENIWRQFVRLVVFTVFLLYPLVSKSALGLYNCVTVEGVSYLIADFELLCYEDTWTIYAALNGVFVAMYPVGIPLTYYYILRRNLSRMREPETILTLGFLYEAYTEQAWYWELVDMLHKLVLTSVVVFAANEQRMAWNMGIIGFYLILLLVQSPYVRKGDDRFHQQVQATLFCIAFVGFILRNENPYVDSLASPATMEGLIAALLIMLVLALLISFVVIAGRNIQKIVRARKRAKALSVDLHQPVTLSPFVVPSTSGSRTNSKNSSKEKEETSHAPAPTSPTDGTSVPRSSTTVPRSSTTVPRSSTTVPRSSVLRSRSPSAVAF